MKLRFDSHGNEKQKEALRLWNDDITTDIGYGGGKYGGKSFLGCNAIFADAYTYDGTFYFIARNKLTDLVRFTLPSIFEVFGIWGLTDKYYRFRSDYNYFELYNGSRVYLIPTEYMPSDPDYQRFGSMQFTRGWGEEIGEWHIKAKTNLQATVGRWRNEEYGLKPVTLWTCNPSRNFAYTQYYRPWRDGSLPEWRRFIQALPADNKKANPAVLENMLRSFTPDDIERLIYGNWEYSDDPASLVTYSAVCDVFTNDFIAPGDESGLSTDLAMKGRDKWIAFHWRGDVAELIIDEKFSEAKPMYERILAESISRSIPRSHIVSDADGLGSYLESFLPGIYEFHGGASANDSDRFANLKSECAFKLAEMIQNHEIKIVAPPEIAEDIKDELMMLKIENLDADTSKKRLISKDKMKAILGHSPDYLDALLMFMARRLEPISEGVINFGAL